jgi:hypothetical protein
VAGACEHGNEHLAKKGGKKKGNKKKQNRKKSKQTKIVANVIHARKCWSYAKYKKKERR